MNGLLFTLLYSITEYNTKFSALFYFTTIQSFINWAYTLFNSFKGFEENFANVDEETNRNRLATILFLHGESYEWNSGNPYDGSELAAHGHVIMVTINFRLGIFGFLKTGGKESAQGNFGLMDLVAGVHWLKENLPYFGGDPQRITLMGHGTGAALANILVISPVASGWCLSSFSFHLQRTL